MASFWTAHGYQKSAVSGEAEWEANRLIDYPFPLRRGGLPVILSLPMGMTQSEAERLAEFIKALVVNAI